MRITIDEQEVGNIVREWAIKVFAQGEKIVKEVKKGSSYSGEYEITVEHGFSVGNETSDKV